MYPAPHASSVRTWAQGRVSPWWLGELGPTAGLTYSWTVPGGYEQMSVRLIRPATFRHTAMNPGRIVEIVRGGSVIWFGSLDEPAHDGTGWVITAHGGGTLGTEWDAIYTNWLDQNDAVSQAIARGLRWQNPAPGIGSFVFLGQQQDSGSLKISDLLNLMTSKAGYTWWVGRDRILQVVAIPSAVTHLLITTAPAARTLAGDINALALRYQSSKDSATAATYATVFATNAASIAAHGRIEEFDDLSSAGQMTAAAAQAVGTNSLLHYQRASYAGPFAAVPGQLLTPGGQPVDPGATQPGMVCKLLIMDGAYGGEVTPTPPVFPAGSYTWDDDTLTATIAPYQTFGLQALVAASQLGPDLAEFLRDQAQARARAEAALDRRQAAAARRREALQDKRERARAEAQLDARQAAARREAARDRAQLAAWRRAHPHKRHHPKF